MRPPRVIVSILEPDAGATARRLAALPPSDDPVEVRADHLEPAEIAGLVRTASRAVLVTVRSAGQGGGFEGSAARLRAVLRSALDAGAALVDVEWGGAAVGLVDGPRALCFVFSHHGAACHTAAIEPLYAAMSATRAGVLKIVPHASRSGEIGAVRELLARAARDRRPLACFATGRHGAASRILAPSWGSWATYAAAEAGRETADGQFSCADLEDLHDVRRISAATAIHALFGTELSRSPSPAMHRAGYRALDLDARYVPVEAIDADDAEAAARAIGARAFGVTLPFKEAFFRRAAPGDSWAERARAVNTVLSCRGGLVGYNTDASAAERLVRSRIDAAGRRAVVVGAGGTGRALAAVLAALGADVAVVNRSPERARAVARDLGVAAAAWSDLERLSPEILVQATPLGADGARVVPAGAVPSALLLDVVYARVPTLAAREAAARGSAVVDGVDLLVEQAIDQFALMTGVRPPLGTLAAAARSRLARA